MEKGKEKKSESNINYHSRVGIFRGLRRKPGSPFDRPPGLDGGTRLLEVGITQPLVGIKSLNLIQLADTG
jgi:hypothetical protein